MAQIMSENCIQTTLTLDSTSGIVIPLFNLSISSFFFCISCLCSATASCIKPNHLLGTVFQFEAAWAINKGGKREKIAIKCSSLTDSTVIQEACLTERVLATICLLQVQGILGSAQAHSLCWTCLRYSVTNKRNNGGYFQLINISWCTSRDCWAAFSEFVSCFSVLSFSSPSFSRH